MPRSNLCIPKSQLQVERFTKWLKKQAKNKELASILGISEQLMSYKTKNNVFTLEDLIRLFNELEVDPSEIVKLLIY